MARYPSLRRPSSLLFAWAKNSRGGCGTYEHRQHGMLTAHSTGSVSIPQEAFIAALRMGDEG
jgi:hypothetical protein